MAGKECANTAVPTGEHVRLRRFVATDSTDPESSDCSEVFWLASAWEAGERSASEVSSVVLLTSTWQLH